MNLLMMVKFLSNDVDTTLFNLIKVNVVDMLYVNLYGLAFRRIFFMKQFCDLFQSSFPMFLKIVLTRK